MTKVSNKTNPAILHFLGNDITELMQPGKHIPEKIVKGSAVHKYTRYVSSENAKTEREALQIKAAQLKKAHHSIHYIYDRNGKKIFNRTSVCSQKKFIEYQNPTWKQVEKINDQTGQITYKHYIGNLAHCNNVYGCPTCANIILRRRERKINNVFEVLNVNNKVYMLTLTVRHTKTQTALEVVDKLFNSWRSWITSGNTEEFRKKFNYFIRAFEVTYSNNSGFHPHFHLVFAKPNKMPVKEFYQIVNPVLILWKRLSGNTSKQYPGYMLTEYENENYIFETNKGITAKELTNIMPGEKIYSGDAMYLALTDLKKWHEYITAVRGKKRVQGSKAFNKLAEILNQKQTDDSEIMQENEAANDIFEFVNSWDNVKKNPVLLAQMKIALDNTDLPEFEKLLNMADLKISKNRYSIIGTNNEE